MTYRLNHSRPHILYNGRMRWVFVAFFFFVNWTTLAAFPLNVALVELGELDTLATFDENHADFTLAVIKLVALFLARWLWLGARAFFSGDPIKRVFRILYQPRLARATVVTVHHRI